jgi:hypothetical protein
MEHLTNIEREFWSQTEFSRVAVSRPLVPVYRVGEPFLRGRRTWPEGSEFAYSPGGLELTLFRSDISDDIISEVRRGEVELALIVELPLIVLAYRFGDTLAWNDVPYCWHMQPPSWRTVPSVDCALEARALLWITLVDATDGIIQAQRGVTLSPRFTRSLQEAIRAQALMPFDPDECTTAVSKIFLTYPSTVDRLSLAEARTMGNE